jgi:hypothetical protein
MPIRSRAARKAGPDRSVIDWPSTSTCPSSGRSSRFTQRSSVDLPAPERPTMPNISPVATSSDTPFNALAEP